MNKQPAPSPPAVEPPALPDVATQPHPTAHAIPEPPGAGEDVKEEVSDANEPAERPRPCP
jgi:hypothetical protein